MLPSRRDSFQNALSLREAMNQLLEDSFVRHPVFGTSGQDFVPAVDLSETAEAFLVEAALPGMKAEDVQVTVENNVLTISGEVRREESTNERNYHRVERRFGSFQRSMSLPTVVEVDKINASLTDGVLKLTIPKAEAVKPRAIKVSVGGGQ
ncbi:MAG: Hsp20/alpha crystallin family protein [Chloroflexaceae bacterium]|nr:Hsp20/alpha crystallin family protein [Chloroflexaceae bacterium]